MPFLAERAIRAYNLLFRMSINYLWGINQTVLKYKTNSNLL